jgi:hypothetical protein
MIPGARYLGRNIVRTYKAGTMSGVYRRKMLLVDQLCLDFQRPECLMETVVEEYMLRMVRGKKSNRSRSASMARDIS